MKMVFVLLATLVGFSASASNSVYVMDNVFTASGPATPNYFLNLNKINGEFKKVSKLELGVLRFAGASVDSAANTVRYNFHQIDEAQGTDTCWSTLGFTTSQSEKGPVVTDVKAEKTCYKLED